MKIKRNITNPKAFIGKRINPDKWYLPEGYALCAMTGKLHSEDDLGVSFAHWALDKAFLVENRIYIEDAEWLSSEGYDQIMDVLHRTGRYSEYMAAVGA